VVLCCVDENEVVVHDEFGGCVEIDSDLEQYCAKKNILILLYLLIARCISLFPMLFRNIFRSLKYGNKSVAISRLSVSSPLSTIAVSSGNAQFRRNRMSFNNKIIREYTDRRVCSQPLNHKLSLLTIVQDLTDVSVLQVIKDTAYIFFQ
jgi:hypothetical protein